MRRRGGLATSSALAAVALVVVASVWRCPVKLVSGYPCPTCGMTRATRLLLHGDIVGATRLHPLVWLTVPVVMLFVGAELVGYARSGTWGASRRIRGADALMLTTATLLFALWIARFGGYFGGPV